MASSEDVAAAKKNVEVCEDPGARVAKLVLDSYSRAVASRGSFAIAIAGGSLVNMLGAMSDIKDVDWTKWHVAWVDERCVPHDHADSNYGGALAAWLQKVPIPKEQIHAIDSTLVPGGGGMDRAQPAADEYERRLQNLSAEVLPRSADGMPVFDLLLLGFGPDGHICSLFPGHPLLEDTSERWIHPIADSPKPPPERITLSMRAVKAASEVALVGTGAGKKDVVKSVFAEGCSLPCARLHAMRPAWILDSAAASELEA